MQNSFFHSLGMNQKETDVFLKMLELGAQPVSVVARQLHMPRSSVYAVLDRLRELHVTEEFTRHGLTYVQCIPAENLEDILEERKHSYETALHQYQMQLPALQRLENRLSITPKVKFFEGKRAVKKMYEDVLQEKEFYSFFDPDSIKKHMKEFLHKIPQMLRENSGRAKEILVHSKTAQEYQNQYNSEFHQIKLFPEGRTFEADWIIGKTRIYLISYGESYISGTEIESASLVQTQRMVFEELWERIP